MRDCVGKCEVCSYTGKQFYLKGMKICFECMLAYDRERALLILERVFEENTTLREKAGLNEANNIKES